MATVTRYGDELIIDTPYSGQFVSDLKRAVPVQCRSWVAPSWHVDIRYEQTIVTLIDVNYGFKPRIIDKPKSHSDLLVEFFKLEYLGRCKDQMSDELMASGFVNGGWSVLFRESALRNHFEGTPLPSSSQPHQPKHRETYYTVLGITNTATQDEIKQAFRRMSRQWHPDVNKTDPDAAAMFIKINEANQFLKDPMRRKKYDFIQKILAEQLAAEFANSAVSSYASAPYYDDDAYGYRAPLKCGMIVAECSKRLGKLVVVRIHSWDDIVNDKGQTMVSSWSMDEKNFVIRWV